MSKYETIKKLKKQGLFKECVKTGLISTNVCRSVDSYEKFNKIISKGTSKMQAYTNIAEDKKISVNSVIKDINNIKK